MVLALCFGIGRIHWRLLGVHNKGKVLALFVLFMILMLTFLKTTLKC